MMVSWVGVVLLVAASAGASEPLRVALSGNYMPLHGPDHGTMVGLEADLAHALGRQLGREVVFVNTRAKFKLGIIEAVAQGKVDIGLSSITPTEERAKKVDFTKPYITLSYAIAGKDADIDGSKDVSALAGRVAAHSAAARQAVEKAMPKATVVHCASLDKGIAMVMDGEAKWVADEDVGLLLAVRATSLLVGSARFGESPLAIAAPIDKAVPIDLALAKIGLYELQQLARKWKPGQLFLPADEVQMVSNLSGTYDEVVAAWYRTSYCISQAPGIEIFDKDGRWQVGIVQPHDTDIRDVHRVWRSGKREYSFKLGAHWRGRLGHLVFITLRWESGRQWTCEGCYPEPITLGERSWTKHLDEMPMDPGDRDERGGCNVIP